MPNAEVEDTAHGIPGLERGGDSVGGRKLRAEELMAVHLGKWRVVDLIKLSLGRLRFEVNLFFDRTWPVGH